MLVAGVDEAGRGPWAGPVVAAAVVLVNPVIGVKDSKLLSTRKRENLFELIQKEALSWGIGLGSVEEIDNLNILQATLLAMRRAINQLSITPQEVWVDGISAPQVPFLVRTFVKGDRLYSEISAASVLAKVFRDRLMQKYDQEFPGYGFAQHKGYGTAQHLEALQRLGVSPLHRRSFAPIRKILEQDNYENFLIKKRGVF